MNKPELEARVEYLEGVITDIFRAVTPKLGGNGQLPMLTLRTIAEKHLRAGEKEICGMEIFTKVEENYA